MSAAMVFSANSDFNILFSGLMSVKMPAARALPNRPRGGNTIPEAAALFDSTMASGWKKCGKKRLSMENWLHFAVIDWFFSKYDCFVSRISAYCGKNDVYLLLLLCFCYKYSSPVW